MQPQKNNKIEIFSDKSFDYNWDNYVVKDLTKDKKIKKILIIKWGSLGDIVISLPIIQDISYSFNDSKIDLNTLPTWKKIFEKDKRFNLVWGNNFRRKFFFIDLIYWLHEVKKHNYDLIIDLQTNDRSRIYLTLFRFLFFSKTLLIGNHPVFPYMFKTKNKEKIEKPFYILKRTISTIGVKPINHKPKIYITEKIKNAVRSLLNRYCLKKKNFIVFIPGSSETGLLKRWGAKKYIQLAKLIENKSPKTKIVIVGGKVDISECNQIFKNTTNTINLCNKTKIVELLEIFSKAKLIISNDTGTAHLASAIKTPVYIINGPTDPRIVKPFGNNIFALQSDIDCKNCYLKICGHHSCMKRLDANDVFKFTTKYI